MTPTATPLSPVITAGARDDAGPTAGGGRTTRAVAIVLAGTYHSIDGAFAGSLPRPLLPVAQIPVLGYVLRWLRDGGIERATICSNSASRAIQTCVGDGSSLSMELEYVE